MCTLANWTKTKQSTSVPENKTPGAYNLKGSIHHITSQHSAIALIVVIKILSIRLNITPRTQDLENCGHNSNTSRATVQ